MGAEIDRLEIEIEAPATKAINALDKLVGKLERLAGSLGSINGNSLSGLSTGIEYCCGRDNADRSLPPAAKHDGGESLSIYVNSK